MYNFILNYISDFAGSSHSDKEVDALTPEKSAAMRGSNVGPGSALVPPIGATPTIAMPERKRKRKGIFIENEKIFILFFAQNLFLLYLIRLSIFR